MTTIQTTLERKIKVKAHEVNRLKELRLAPILYLLEDLATEHANHLGIGFKSLDEKGQSWVLARMRFEIEKFPYWEEELIAKTWSNGVTGLFPLRNWQLEYPDGDICFKGHAHYLIIDQKSRRPVRVTPDDFKGLTHDVQATEEAPQKLSPLKGGTLLHKFNVYPSHIDINHHVNHSNYFAWVWDALSFEFTEKFHPVTAEINFLKEIAFPSDDVLVTTNADRTVFEISTESNGVHARLQIQWREK